MTSLAPDLLSPGFCDPLGFGAGSALVGGGGTCVVPVVGRKRSEAVASLARASVEASKLGINCSENPAIKHQTTRSARSLLGKKAAEAEGES